MRDPSPPPDDIAGDGAGLSSAQGPVTGAYGGNGRADRPRPAGAFSRADRPPEHLLRAGTDAGTGPGDGLGDDPGGPSDSGGSNGPGGQATPEDGWAEGVQSRTPRPLDDDDSPRRGRHARRARKGKPPRSLARTIVEWVAVVGGGIVIALVIEAFLIQAFWIPSPSMVPTLDVGDRVLVNKLSYHLHDVHRGDVVVFKKPEGVSGDESIEDLIKRVIAVGGDTIESRNGLVYVNGERVDESDYLEPGTPTDDLKLTKVPEGKVFVMGDNRTNSQDSRVFGPVDEDTIVGRAFIKVLPLSDIGWL